MSRTGRALRRQAFDETMLQSQITTRKAAVSKAVLRKINVARTDSKPYAHWTVESVYGGTVTVAVPETALARIKRVKGWD